MLLWPIGLMEKAVEFTNGAIHIYNEQHEKRKAISDVSLVELYNFIGVRLTTVLERRPISVEEHCRSKPYPDSIKVPADFKHVSR
jgi:hypothetical protein